MNKMIAVLFLIVLSGCGSESFSALDANLETESAGLQVPPQVRARSNPLEVGFTVQDDWGGGFVAEVTLFNRGSTAVEDWSVAFDFDRQIGNSWNAVVMEHNGGRIRFGPAAYNSNIAAGASISFGFVANPGGYQKPTVFEVTAGGIQSDPSPTPSPTATTPPPPSQQVELSFSKDSDWGSGMNGSINITNVSNTDLKDWRVSFDLPAQITNSWNAEQLHHVGSRYQFGPAPYNLVIAPGATVTLGFQAAPGGVVATGLLFSSAQSGGDPQPDPDPTPNPDPDPPTPIETGYLGTQGARIVDSNGAVVRLTGLNWFGMETETFCPHGLWARSMDSCLDQIAGLGYNCLRVPYSSQLFDAQSTPNGINFALNPDLQGLSGIEIMDRLVDECEERGLRVILDRHRPSSSAQSELWYTSQYSEERWISDWEMLARRYLNRPTVVGFDLHNEPHGPATWGNGDPLTDWRLAAQRAGNRILAVNPNLLILVEGVAGDYWWGGDLSGAKTQPVVLNVPGRVVYSPHDYPQSVFAQTWFQAADYPNNLEAIWDRHWGYLVREDIAPVLLGEFGTRYQTQSDRQWFHALANYIQGNGLSFTFWCFNPNSTDTGGLLQDDWTNIHTAKQDVLAPLLY